MRRIGSLGKRAGVIGLIGILCCLGGLSHGADKWKNLTTDDGLPGNEIQFLEQDADGTIWIGTLSGLGAYKNGKLSVVIEKGRFWDVLRVGPNKFWVGAAHGAVLLDGQKQEVGLKGSTVAPILPYDDKTIWAIRKNLGSEENALAQNSGEDWQVVEKFKKSRVVNLYKASDGTMWLSVDADGVYAVKPKQGVDAAVHHLEGLNVTAMMEDSKKRVWIGLWERGVAMYDGSTWHRHLKKEKSYTFALREDTGGTIWVATNQNGLWRFDGKEWVNDLREEGGINTLETTSDGKVWISSQAGGGLRYWQNNKWNVSLDSPLPIRCLIETKSKQIWAGGVLDGVHIKQ